MNNEDWGIKSATVGTDMANAAYVQKSRNKNPGTKIRS